MLDEQDSERREFLFLFVYCLQRTVKRKHTRVPAKINVSRARLLSGNDFRSRSFSLRLRPIRSWFRHAPPVLGLDTLHIRTSFRHRFFLLRNRRAVGLLSLFALRSFYWLWFAV